MATKTYAKAAEPAIACPMLLQCCGAALAYHEALGVARAGNDPRASSDNTLQQRMIPASRHAIDTLGATGAIGDEAYRAVEKELDWLELSDALGATITRRDRWRADP